MMYGKVIIPTDGSEYSLVSVKEGLKLAKNLGIPAAAVHVIPPYHPGKAFGRYRIEELGHRGLNEMVKILKHRGDSILSEVKKLAGEMDVKLETHTFEGRVYEKICELAEKEDMLYISSHGRSGISSYLMGSTTERVLKHAKADVAVVKTKSD